MRRRDAEAFLAHLSAQAPTCSVSLAQRRRQQQQQQQQRQHSNSSGTGGWRKVRKEFNPPGW